MENSYSALGRWFEYLNKDCDYEQWSQYLISVLEEQNAGKNGLDIGCGNGYFTRALIKRGYNVKGIDLSPQMLDTAQSLALSEGVKAEFLLGDITKLKVTAKQDFCIAINDCINYLPKVKLRSAFSRVANCLKKGGIFFFDISSRQKIESVLGNNLFCEDGEDITYIWFNSLNEDNVVMDLTFFVRESDGKYSRFDERHIQYIHDEEEILKILKEEGFDAKYLPHPQANKGERIDFICKKR